MTTLAGTRPDFATDEEADAMNMISTLTEGLIAYAEGRQVDMETGAVLDEMILDYFDSALEIKVARDVEALMRVSPNVARLVADKTEETQLQNRLSMFFDGELDSEASADIQRMIDGDPEVAKLARQIRQGGDYLRVVLQPIPGQHVSRNDVAAIKAEFAGASDDAASIARFSTLVDYAMGMAIDKKTRSLLDEMILRYLGGTLDRVSMLGLEASMRLVPSVARLVADKAGERSGLSSSTAVFRHRALKKKVVGSAGSRSRHVESL